MISRMKIRKIEYVVFRCEGIQVGRFTREPESSKGRSDDSRSQEETLREIFVGKAFETDSRLSKGEVSLSISEKSQTTWKLFLFIIYLHYSGMTSFPGIVTYLDTTYPIGTHGNL